MAQSNKSFASYLSYLKSIAQNKGVSCELSIYAQKESQKYLPFSSDHILTAGEKSRCYAYYFAVIKKHAPKEKNSSKYEQRGVLSTFISTLKKCGRCADDIVDEMFRNYGASLDKALLDEYCLKIKAA